MKIQDYKDGIIDKLPSGKYRYIAKGAVLGIYDTMKALVDDNPWRQYGKKTGKQKTGRRKRVAISEQKREAKLAKNALDEGSKRRAEETPSSEQ